MDGSDADRSPDGMTTEAASLMQRISNLMVAMQKEFYGRGPDRTKSYMVDDLLFVVMRGGVTRAEQTMLDFGQEDLVRNFRQQFENEMTRKLVGAIEQITGRTVRTYQCQIMFDPHIVCQIFVFEGQERADEPSRVVEGAAADIGVGDPGGAAPG